MPLPRASGWPPITASVAKPRSASQLASVGTSPRSGKGRLSCRARAGGSQPVRRFACDGSVSGTCACAFASASPSRASASSAGVRARRGEPSGPRTQSARNVSIEITTTCLGAASPAPSPSLETQLALAATNPAASASWKNFIRIGRGDARSGARDARLVLFGDQDLRAHEDHDLALAHLRALAAREERDERDVADERDARVELLVDQRLHP